MNWMHLLLFFNLQTDIGYGRAWVRLALERKCLSQFLQTLTADPVLLKNLYKRYDFPQQSVT